MTLSRGKGRDREGDLRDSKVLHLDNRCKDPGQKVQNSTFVALHSVVDGSL